MNTLKKSFTTFSFLIILVLNAKGQYTEIGQDAKLVKSFIESTTNSRTGYDTYGNSKGNNVFFNVEYSDGEIKDVYQCFVKQYLIDYGSHANYCKHHIMENGKLAYTLTQFEDISTSNLKAHYNKLYGDNKIGELYYSDDYKHFSKIYLANNNLATIEWRKTNTKNLPKNIQDILKQKTNIQEQKEVKKENIDVFERPQNRTEIATTHVNAGKAVPNKIDDRPSKDLFIGTKKFCDGEDSWYYLVTIDGDNITLKSFADKKNKYHKDKTTSTEIIKGKLKNNKIITKDKTEYLTNRFRYENGVLFEMNNEGGDNEYTQCK